MMVKFEQVEAYCRRREKEKQYTLIELPIVDSILITSIHALKREQPLYKGQTNKLNLYVSIIIIIPKYVLYSEVHCYSTDQVKYKVHPYRVIGDRLVVDHFVQHWMSTLLDG